MNYEAHGLRDIFRRRLMLNQFGDQPLSGNQVDETDKIDPFYQGSPQPGSNGRNFVHDNHGHATECRFQSNGTRANHGESTLTKNIFNTI